MATFVDNCPRCNATLITFDLIANKKIRSFQSRRPGSYIDWLEYEAFCVCRHCERSTVFILQIEEIKENNAEPLLSANTDVSNKYKQAGFVSIKDQKTRRPPQFVPSNIESAFSEGAACLSIQCWNAAATMFRKCIDLATIKLIPLDLEEKKKRVLQRSLGWRLEYLFNHNILPRRLKSLANYIKEDGNFGAHQGELKKEDVIDIVHFTELTLQEIYTIPEQIRRAQERQNKR